MRKQNGRMGRGRVGAGKFGGVPNIQAKEPFTCESWDLSRLP